MDTAVGKNAAMADGMLRGDPAAISNDCCGLAVTARGLGTADARRSHKVTPMSASASRTDLAGKHVP
eukprot:139493-Prorocentrum_lima.AAC.1